MAEEHPLMRSIGTALLVAAGLVGGLGILLGVGAFAAGEVSNGFQVLAGAVLLATLLAADGWYLRRRYPPLP